MELTQENVEKLNVAKMPDALLCKGLLLDAIEAGDALEKELSNLRQDYRKISELYIAEQNKCGHLEARIKELEEVISKMETTTPKWISVEDVLPQWGKLVKIKFKDGKEDERRFSADYKWVSKGMQTCESVGVTHWMPLPSDSTTEDPLDVEKEK